MLVFFALGNAKVLYFALGDAKVTKTNVFGSQWNIGFNVCDTTNIAPSALCSGTGDY